MRLDELKNTTTRGIQGSWAPSTSASKASVIGLTMGASLLLTVSPALARTSDLVAVQALQREVVFFLGAVACLPAILLVGACILRIGVTMMARRWQPMFESTISLSPRSWRTSRAFVNVPALHAGPQAYHVSLPELDTAPIASEETHGSGDGLQLELERAMRAAS